MRLILIPTWVSITSSSANFPHERRRTSEEPPRNATKYLKRYHPLLLGRSRQQIHPLCEPNGAHVSQSSPFICHRHLVLLRLFDRPQLIFNRSRARTSTWIQQPAAITITHHTDDSTCVRSRRWI